MRTQTHLSALIVLPASRFVVKIPAGYPLEAAGPVLCAGITMFTPLIKHSADKGGLRVGIVGIGGLGQMGVMLAKAMGNTVTAISTSPNKEAAAREIGADNFLVSTESEKMKEAAGSLDLILNTISGNHDISSYLSLLVTLLSPLTCLTTISRCRTLWESVFS